MSIDYAKFMEKKGLTDKDDFVYRYLEYGEGRTKQAFKDQCDINKIIKKAQKAGSLAHVQKYPEAVYGEFDGYDLLEAYGKLERAKEIFAELPSEVRNEFSNDALAFAGFASNPVNSSRLAELLPAIAEPERYFPNPVNAGKAGAGEATPKDTAAKAKQEAEPPPGQAANDEQAAPEAASEPSSST